jgi:hypothetical protein
MTITMVQIQLRDCDYAIAMPGMAHGPYPGLIEMAAAIEGQPGHPRHSKDGRPHEA